MSEEKRQAKRGIWTPWAACLCYACHGPEFKKPNGTVTIDADEFEELQKPLSSPPSEHNQIAPCDECGTPIWLRWDVAHHRRIVERVPGMKMAQTGGTCSAAESSCDEPHVLVVVRDDDLFAVSVWPDEETRHNEWQVADDEIEREDYTFDTEDEVVEFLTGLVNT